VGSFLFPFFGSRRQEIEDRSQELGRQCRSVFHSPARFPSPGTRHRALGTCFCPFLCFHKHRRMHLHFLRTGDWRKEAEVRSWAGSADPDSIPPPVRRSPGTRHRALGTCFCPFLCFHKHRRMHLHFLKRDKGHGARDTGGEVENWFRPHWPPPRPDLESSMTIFPSLCFHKHRRMHLHFLRAGDWRKEAEVRSRGGSADPDSIPPPVRRSPGTRHRALGTCFCPFLCFHEHRRMHLHFMKRDKGHGGEVANWFRPHSPPSRPDLESSMTFFPIPLFSSTSPDAPSFLRAGDRRKEPEVRS